MILIKNSATFTKDQSNSEVSDINKAFDILGKKASDVSARVKWLNVEDIFFKNTKPHIRIVTKW